MAFVIALRLHHFVSQELVNGLVQNKGKRVDMLK